MWIGIHKYFQVAFPILQILDFVEEEKSGLCFFESAGFAYSCGEFFNGQMGIEGLVERQASHGSGGHALVQQSLDDVLQQYGFADAARPHQHHGAAHIFGFHQFGERLDAGARAHVPIHIIGLVRRPAPPGIFNAHPRHDLRFWNRVHNAGLWGE